MDTIVDFYRDTTIGRQIRDEGRAEGHADVLVAVLTARFGADPRIPAVATGLSTLEPQDAVARITAATDLTGLIDPDR